MMAHSLPLALFIPFMPSVNRGLCASLLAGIFVHAHIVFMGDGF